VKDYLRVARYRAINLGKANSCVIYLTPRRSLPSVADPSVVACAWKDVAQAIRAVIMRDESRSSFKKQALSQLAQHFDQL